MLFFGWYPQKETFFNWKKWLHLFPYRKEKRVVIGLQGPRGKCGGTARAGGQGGHLGLLGVISLDAYLHPSDADLEDAAGGRVKVHGEPAGGGNLWVGQGHQVLLHPPQGRTRTGRPPWETGTGTFCIAAQRTSLPLW